MYDILRLKKRDMKAIHQNPAGNKMILVRKRRLSKESRAFLFFKKFEIVFNAFLLPPLSLPHNLQT